MGTAYFRPLSVEFIPPGALYHDYEETEPMPGHETVIRPLLENCLYALVFGIKKDSELYKANADILISDKGKFRLDTSKDCLTGHAYLWNARTWTRGSIIIVLKPDAVDFNDLFPHTYRPSFNDTPNSGNTLSAVKKCGEEAEAGNIAICFSASNGTEWISIYAKGQAWDDILTAGEKHCHQKDYYLPR
ncbi:hypothetical protein [Chitinophaga varians]|uniref:hypothetical protein n=1 Tax=Chitinophaga varians TaxID=2202339 RepID=UPI00165FCDEA|nr:hypothetical protein [Chitinophaga varians]MBC9909928.1 hypothetical protein [Chitinophaga varians]